MYPHSGSISRALRRLLLTLSLGGVSLIFKRVVYNPPTSIRVRLLLYLFPVDIESVAKYLPMHAQCLNKGRHNKHYIYENIKYDDCSQ